MLSGEEDSILTCAVCWERFDEDVHKPKLLQCHHSFCQECLKQCASRSVTSVRTGGQNILCPTCRKVTGISKKGIAALQDNFYLIPHIRQPSHLSSDVEDEKSAAKKGAAIWCSVCLQVATSECMGQHTVCVLDNAINQMVMQMKATVENTCKSLSEQVVILSEQLEFLDVVKQGCTSGLAMKFAKTMASKTMELSILHNHLDDLRSKSKISDPVFLLQDVEDAEMQLKKVSGHHKTLLDHLDIMNTVQKCSIMVDCPNEKWKDTFKVDDLPSMEKNVIMYMLYELLVKKRNKDSSKLENAAMEDNMSWKEVMSKRASRYDSSNTTNDRRAKSKDVTSVKSSSYPRAQSAGPLALGGKTLSVLKNPPLSKGQCYMDITCNNKPMGRIIFLLRPDRAPKLCSNFLALCEGHDGYGYRGSKIFRGIPNDSIIGGDFINNDGTGGHSIYKDKGWFLADDSNLQDEFGALRMRGMGMDESSGRGLVGSQFHIWVGKRSFRAYRRTLVFGHVVEGIEICKKVSHFKCKKNSTGKMVIQDNIVISVCGKL